VVFPSTILFVAHDAHPNISKLSLSDPDFAPAFDRWRRLRLSGIAVDFQRILRADSGLRLLEDAALDLAAFDEGPALGRSGRGSTQIYWRRIDGALVVVKSVSLPAPIGRCQIATEIENLLNLRHPLIAPLVGFVFPAESGGCRELKTARLRASGGSLADVLSNPPAWWTPTAKAKAVVGIALALRFAHGLGLLHGALKATNVLFDADRRILLADFSSIRLQTGDVEPFSGENWSPTADVCAFVSLLFEITVGRPAIPHIGAGGELLIPAGVPAFVSAMIEDGGSPESQCRLSFTNIAERLKENRFAIVAGVNSQQVSGFVDGANRQRSPAPGTKRSNCKSVHPTARETPPV
jgi:serine/threonine protein kinase